MVSGTNVYTRCDTTGGQELRRIPIAGGASTSVHSSALFPVGNGPAGDASFAYFAELDQAVATKILAKKVANTGGSPTTVGEVPAAGTASCSPWTRRNVYAARLQANNTALEYYKIPVAGGAATALGNPARTLKAAR